MAFAKSLEKTVRAVERTVFYIGSAFLVVIMFMVTIDVGGRAILNTPLLGAQELSEFMLAGAVFLGLGYTQILKGHVIVELVFDRLPLKARQVLKVIHSFIAAVVFAVIAWQGAVMVVDTFNSQLASEVLEIPAWIFRSSVPIGGLLIALVLLIEFFQNIYAVTRREGP